MKAFAQPAPSRKRAILARFTLFVMPSLRDQ